MCFWGWRGGAILPSLVKVMSPTRHDCTATSPLHENGFATFVLTVRGERRSYRAGEGAAAFGLRGIRKETAACTTPPHRRRGCRSVVVNAAVFSWTPQRSIRGHSSLADVATLMPTPQGRSRRRTCPNDAAAFPTTPGRENFENLWHVIRYNGMLYLILQPKFSKVFRLFGALAAGLRSTARSRPPT